MTREAFYEREYNARAAIPEHPRIFARWAEQGAMARRLRACLIDLPYGETPAERLDYFPTRQDAAPLLVFIHGGYWRSLDKSDFAWLAPPFVQHGVALALPNYGLAPQTTIEDMVRQQLRALAWLYRNGDRLGFDPERIVVAGHSAGAHLAVMMMAAVWPAYEADLPRSLVKGGLALSGIYDLAPLVQAPFVNADLKLDARRAHTSVAGITAAVDHGAADHVRRRTRILGVPSPDRADRPRLEGGTGAQCADARHKPPDRGRRTCQSGVSALRRGARTGPRQPVLKLP